MLDWTMSSASPSGVARDAVEVEPGLMHVVAAEGDHLEVGRIRETAGPTERHLVEDRLHRVGEPRGVRREDDVVDERRSGRELVAHEDLARVGVDDPTVARRARRQRRAERWSTFMPTDDVPGPWLITAPTPVTRFTRKMSPSARAEERPGPPPMAMPREGTRSARRTRRERRQPLRLLRVHRKRRCGSGRHGDDDRRDHRQYYGQRDRVRDVDTSCAPLPSPPVEWSRPPTHCSTSQSQGRCDAGVGGERMWSVNATVDTRPGARRSAVSSPLPPRPRLRGERRRHHDVRRRLRCGRRRAFRSP